jgi:ABC-type transport system substrate-binding protein
MNNRKVALLSVIVMGVFALSAIGNAAQFSHTSGQAVVENFSLVVETNVGNRRRESFALYLRQALAPLGIDVEVLGKPFNQFVGDLLHFTDTEWDIAIVGFVGGSPFAPSYVDLYSCRGGFFGVLTYQLCDDVW